MRDVGARFKYCGQWWTVLAVEEMSYRVRSDEDSYGFISFAALGDARPDSVTA
jgi:hypothetical protein